MKTLSIVSLTVLATCIIFTNTLCANDLREGFLGLTWGTNLSTLAGFQKIETKENVTYYKNPEKVYTVEDMTVGDIVYGAYANQFFAVYVHIDSIEGFGKIRQYLTANYGEPKRSMTIANEQRINSWKYKTVKIKLKFYVRDGKMKLAFYHTPVSTMVNEAQQESYLDQKYRFLPIDKNKKPTGGIPLLKF